MSPHKSALLLSGGMDSIALAAWKRPEICLTIDYGQKAAGGEIQAATCVCRELGLTHDVIRVDCSSLGSGDLAGLAPSEIAPVPEWWPFRNQLLVTLGVMRAVSLDITELMIGSVQTDSTHTDGTPEFYRLLHSVIAFQEGGIQVTAPAIYMTTSELIRRSGAKLDLLAFSHSCHTGNLACGQCRGCNKHRNVMAELGYDAY